MVPLSRTAYLVLVACLATAGARSAPPAASGNAPPRLPGSETRRLQAVVREATWMSVDAAPDGSGIVFDVLGDIYVVPTGGGKARRVLGGAPYESQPAFSPDGRRLAFISDRSGSNNLWIADVDGGNPEQVSHDEGQQIYASPSWSADGRSLFVSRLQPAQQVFEIVAHHVGDRASTVVTTARPSGTESFPDSINSIGGSPSPDGRYLYYARRMGATWTLNGQSPAWSIHRRELKTGVDEPYIALPLGAMKPVVSRSGKWLAYAVRHASRTGLRVRNLDTLEDRWLAYPIEKDGHNDGVYEITYSDLLPGYAFLPDDRGLVIAIDGRIQHVGLDGGRREIPFEADVDLALSSGPRVRIEEDKGPVRARIAQSPRLSPDGRRVAFTALGNLYVMALSGDGNAGPVQLVGAGGSVFHPSWSPDGRELAYVSWSAVGGGAVFRIAATAGAAPVRLTDVPAFYSEPVFLEGGRAIAFLRASQRDRLHALMETSPQRSSDVCVIDALGSKCRVVASAVGARVLRANAVGDRLRYQTPSGVHSVAVHGDGTVRTELSVTAPPLGIYSEKPASPDAIVLAPAGDRALVRRTPHLYLVDLPPAGGAGKSPAIDLSKAIPGKRLTRIGADDADWSADGRQILWSLGSVLHRVPLDDVAQGGDFADAVAETFAARVEVPRDVPEGLLLLRGARAITMRGDEVIDAADILVEGGRIRAIGTEGGLDVPAGTTIRELRGKFILPGFVDTHAHWTSMRRDIQDWSDWTFASNLAYGVTSGLDVQAFSTDVFVYQDMIDAGRMLGPRAYSAGRGIFSDSGIGSLEDAVDVLTRYRDYYRTRNVKAYTIGERRQRRWFAEAARTMGMMATTEGAVDMRLDMTHAIDGFAGTEHNLPVTPLRQDVVELFARTGIGYTPTLSVLFGGLAAKEDMFIRNFGDLERLRRFMPSEAIDAKSFPRAWTSPAELGYPAYAADALAIQRAGGMVGIGSHGELQGLGYHWEMEAYASGGATPREVLRAATINSSRIIGRDADIGSLEPGKFADLVVLDQDPLRDIRNTKAISHVMKNGRLYDAQDLGEVWPRERAAPAPWFLGDVP